MLHNCYNLHARQAHVGKCWPPTRVQCLQSKESQIDLKLCQCQIVTTESAAMEKSACQFTDVLSAMQNGQWLQRGSATAELVTVSPNCQNRYFHGTTFSISLAQLSNMYFHRTSFCAVSFSTPTFQLICKYSFSPLSSASRFSLCIALLSYSSLILQLGLMCLGQDWTLFLLCFSILNSSIKIAFEGS